MHDMQGVFAPTEGKTMRPTEGRVATLHQVTSPVEAGRPNSGGGPAEKERKPYTSWCSMA